MSRFSKLAVVSAIIALGLIVSPQTQAGKRKSVVKYHSNYKLPKVRSHRVRTSPGITPRNYRVGSTTRLKQHYELKQKHIRHRKNKHANRYNNPIYNGPLIINVPQALKQRRIGIYSNTGNNKSNLLNRHEISNGGVYVSSRSRAVYYNDKDCKAGKTCVIRLGPNRSSPKMIVIGKPALIK